MTWAAILSPSRAGSDVSVLSMHRIRTPHYRTGRPQTQNEQPMASSNRKRSSVLALCAFVCLSILTAGAQERGREGAPQGQAPAGRGRAAGPGYL